MDNYEVFGDKNWDDVRNVIAYRLRRRFPGVNDWDIEDAVQDAMVDLLEYWFFLPSSVDPDDPKVTFDRACLRGSWMSAQFLASELAEKAASLDDDDHPRESSRRLTDPNPGPEDICIHNQVNEALASIDADTPATRGWVIPLLHGWSQAEVAKAEGVSQGAICRRLKRLGEQLAGAMA